MFKKRAPTPEQRKAFGKVIRDARNRLGLTQEQLAELMNCSVRWIIQIETGKSNPNNMDTVLLMTILKLLPEDVAKEVGLRIPEPSKKDTEEVEQSVPVSSH